MRPWLKNKVDDTGGMTPEDTSTLYKHTYTHTFHKIVKTKVTLQFAPSFAADWQCLWVLLDLLSLINDITLFPGKVVPLLTLPVSPQWAFLITPVSGAVWCCHQRHHIRVCTARVVCGSFAATRWFAWDQSLTPVFIEMIPIPPRTLIVKVCHLSVFASLYQCQL